MKFLIEKQTNKNSFCTFVQNSYLHHRLDRFRFDQTTIISLNSKYTYDLMNPNRLNRFKLKNFTSISDYIFSDKFNKNMLRNRIKLYKRRILKIIKMSIKL